MIELRGVTFGYPGHGELFSGYDWSVQRGESWAIVGPSGCGKTTLLYLLAGLRRPDAGQVRVGGEALTSPRPQTGLILQDYGLLPWAKAWDNVALGLRIRGVGTAEIRQRVDYWMERLSIRDVRDKYPGALSGGQRQRVAIARTLTLEPDLLLMDEPFSSLDAFTREDMQGLAVSLLDEGDQVSSSNGRSTISLGRTNVLVTHDVQEAAFLGRRILVLGRPPALSATFIENPGAHEPGYRESAGFYEMCRRIKAAVASSSDGSKITAEARRHGGR